MKTDGKEGKRKDLITIPAGDCGDELSDSTGDSEVGILRSKDSSSSDERTPIQDEKHYDRQKNIMTMSDNSFDDSPSLTQAEQEIYHKHADRIRQNAIQLLKTEAAPSSMTSFRSYHNPPDTYISSLQSQNIPSQNHSAYGATESDLNISHVASLAFNCIANCLTEGYRAASSYYSGLEQDENFSHNYQNVERDDNFCHRIPVDNGVGLTHVGGYQNQQMERGVVSYVPVKELIVAPQQSDVRVAGYYAEVPMPSTYQGGKMTSLT